MMNKLERKLVEKAYAMLAAWERGKFGSQHHTITGVMAAVGALQKAEKSKRKTTVGRKKGKT